MRGCVQTAACVSRPYFRRNSCSAKLSFYNESIVDISFSNLFSSFGINFTAAGVVSQK